MIITGSCSSNLVTIPGSGNGWYSLLAPTPGSSNSNLEFPEIPLPTGIVYTYVY